MNHLRDSAAARRAQPMEAHSALRDSARPVAAPTTVVRFEPPLATSLLGSRTVRLASTVLIGLRLGPYTGRRRADPIDSPFRDAILVRVVISGDESTRVDGRTEREVRGSVWVAGPLAEYDYGVATQSESALIRVPFIRLPPEIERFVRGSDTFAAPTSIYTKALEKATTTILTNPPSVGSDSVMILENTVVELVSAVIERARSDQRSSDAIPSRVAAEVRRIIDQRYTEPGLNGAAIAAQLQISLRRLQRILMAEGTSVSIMVRDRRLAALDESLRSSGPNVPVQALAQAVGFGSPAYAAREFGRRFGVPMSRYRRERRGIG